MGFEDAQVVFVTVKVPKEAIAEFMEVMNVDAAESRKEDGCLRFDLLKGAEDDDGTFYHFYEVYKDKEAAAHHKTLPHYQGWATFKAKYESVSKSQTVVKSTGAFPF